MRRGTGARTSTSASIIDNAGREIITNPTQPLDPSTLYNLLAELKNAYGYTAGSALTRIAREAARIPQQHELIDSTGRDHPELEIREAVEHLQQAAAKVIEIGDLLDAAHNAIADTGHRPAT